MAVVERLAQISLNSADPEALARFYVEALGFSAAGDRPARDTRLALGSTRLDLMRARGRPYPDNLPSWSQIFQHCAIAVTDITRAFEHLRKSRGWSPISTRGPERLPESSGGVSAFKFRDPEGHPLELIMFPDAALHARPGVLFLDIDHSAISVADTGRSVAFYASLGLRPATRSLNTGLQQARLDNIAEPVLEVTALDLASGAKPHVELLCYRGVFERELSPTGAADIAATRLVFEAKRTDELDGVRDRHSDKLIAAFGANLVLRDPDGHIVEIEAAR